MSFQFGLVLRESIAHALGDMADFSSSLRKKDRSWGSTCTPLTTGQALMTFATFRALAIAGAWISVECVRRFRFVAARAGLHLNRNPVSSLGAPSPDFATLGFAIAAFNLSGNERATSCGITASAFSRQLNSRGVRAC